MDKKSSMGRWISILYRYRQIHLNKELKKFNIGSGQSMFLYPLYFHDGISQEDLSHMLKIDKGTTARAIKKLEQEGYIERKQDNKDKRSYKLYVTEKGIMIKPDLFQVSFAWNDIITTDFTDEEKDLALQLLERMSNNACKYIMENSHKNRKP